VALYPGWDSLDSVRTWHTVFEISGIAFLALLVGAEILAFQYGHRKDELTAIAESVAETKRQSDADAAEARRKRDVDALQTQLSEADRKVAELDRLRQPRHLTDNEKAKLGVALKDQPVGNLVIKAGAMADDARAYAEEISAFLQRLGWSCRIDNAIFTGSDIKGIWLTIRDAKYVPEGTAALQNAFEAAALPIHKEVSVDSGIPPDEIWLSVGTKI
jgi:hypothetical protein